MKAEIYPTFDDFWDAYDKKVGAKKARAKWAKLSYNTKIKIMEYIPRYKQAQPDKQYRKNPETFFNNESWNDEIISTNAWRSGGLSRDNEARLREGLSTGIYIGLD